MGWLRATTFCTEPHRGRTAVHLFIFLGDYGGFFISPELWLMIFGHSSKIMVFLFSPPPCLRLSLALDWIFPVPRTLSHIEHEKCLVRFTWSFYGSFGLFSCFLLVGLTLTSLLTIFMACWRFFLEFLFSPAPAPLTILLEGHCTGRATISSCGGFLVGFLPIVSVFSCWGREGGILLIWMGRSERIHYPFGVGCLALAVDTWLV